MGLAVSVAEVSDPAFGRQLDETQITRIAVYVYSLSHRGAMAKDSASARAAAGP